MQKEISSNSSDVIEELYKEFNDKYNLEFILSFHANTKHIPPKGEATIQDFINAAKEINEPDSIFIHIDKDDNEKKTEMMKDQLFCDILAKHKYFMVYKNPDAEKGRIYIEPEYPTEMTDWVKENCGNIIYHITADVNADSILHHGVSLCDKQKKHNQNLYQRFYNKEKAFFVAVKDNEDVDLVLDSVAQDFFAYYKENPIYLKVDLNECDGIELFKDTAMCNTNNKYTYSVFSTKEIPMECISILDVKPSKLEYYEK